MRQLSVLARSEGSTWGPDKGKVLTLKTCLFRFSSNPCSFYSVFQFIYKRDNQPKASSKCVAHRSLLQCLPRALCLNDAHCKRCHVNFERFFVVRTITEAVSLSATVHIFDTWWSQLLNVLAPILGCLSRNSMYTNWLFVCARDSQFPYEIQDNLGLETKLCRLSRKMQLRSRTVVTRY